MPIRQESVSGKVPSIVVARNTGSVVVSPDRSAKNLLPPQDAHNEYNEITAGEKNFQGYKAELNPVMDDIITQGGGLTADPDIVRT